MRGEPVDKHKGLRPLLGHLHACPVLAIMPRMTSCTRPLAQCINYTSFLTRASQVQSEQRQVPQSLSVLLGEAFQACGVEVRLLQTEGAGTQQM